MRRFNWPLWTGFLLSIAAFISYPTIFVRLPLTRDIPWANWLLFAIAIVLLVIGFRRAQRKVLPGIVTTLGLAIAVFFGIFTIVLTRQLPASTAAPHVGQKAPDFTLPDSTGHLVSLSQLEATSPRGVLLIFYRGYW